MRPGPCVYRTEWTAVGMPPRGPLMETMVRPVAIRRNVGFDVFNVRLLIGLDKLLRAKRRYQGDLSASINDALLAVDLNTVKLVALQGKKKQTARETQVVILRRLIRRIQRIADARGCSINQLVNSGLMAHYSKQRSGKLGGSSRPTRQATKAAYDKMRSEERRVGKECQSTCRSRWSPYHYKKKDAPSANDDASGNAAVMEMARVMV